MKTQHGKVQGCKRQNNLILICGRIVIILYWAHHWTSSVFTHTLVTNSEVPHTTKPTQSSLSLMAQGSSRLWPPRFTPSLPAPHSVYLSINTATSELNPGPSLWMKLAPHNKRRRTPAVLRRVTLSYPFKSVVRLSQVYGNRWNYVISLVLIML